jgi:hypothetical protein
MTFSNASHRYSGSIVPCSNGPCSDEGSYEFDPSDGRLTLTGADGPRTFYVTVVPADDLQTPSSVRPLDSLLGMCRALLHNVAKALLEAPAPAPPKFYDHAGFSDIAWGGGFGSSGVPVEFTNKDCE